MKDINIDKIGWEKVKFGDVCHLMNDSSRNPQKEGFQYVVGLEHIEPNNLHIRSWESIENETTFTRIFRKGQVLFGRRRAYQRKVAYTEFEGICSGDIMVFEAKQEKLIPELLPFIVQSEGFFQCAIDTSAGSLSPRTKFADLANYEFLLPPKDQQARLAELLWAADEVVERNLKALTHLEGCKRSYLLNKCEDKNQPLISFSDLVEINPSIEMPTDKSMLVSFISMADVSNEGLLINKEDKPLKEVARNGFTPFCENDILFAKITPCMENGKGAITKGLTNGMGLGSTEFHVLRPKSKSDLQFCFYLSRVETFRKKAERLMTGSAGQKRVQPEFFDYYKFHAPNPQRRKIIGETLDNIEKEINFVRAHISNSQQLKSALINQIF
jgi:type I restriction enzyme S subunit